MLEVLIQVEEEVVLEKIQVLLVVMGVMVVKEL
jgi:hypothetical protein